MDVDKVVVTRKVYRYEGLNLWSNDMVIIVGNAFRLD
jgi:hypothetical protein